MYTWDYPCYDDELNSIQKAVGERHKKNIISQLLFMINFDQ